MSAVTVPVPVGGTPIGQTGQNLRLRGRWLLFARAVWSAITLLCLAVVIGSIPVDLKLFRTVCAGASCIASQQLTADGARGIERLGLSMSVYGALSLSLIVLTACVWCGVGLVIFWRKSEEWMASLLALMLVFQGANTIANPVQGIISLWQFPALLVSYVGFLVLFLALLVFPDGRFRPGWSRWLAIIWTVALWFGYFTSFPETLLPLFILSWAGLLSSLLIIQVYRYRRVSTPAQRQQTKWVVLGVAATLSFEIADAVLTVIFPSLGQSGSLAGLLLGDLTTFAPIVLPVSIGIAILRSRLWDIDLIINRTLVYGSLTTILAAIYFGSVLSTQAVSRAITGQVAANPVVIVLSTLLIAALFNPLRRGIQRGIDRRFYRTKYDAARTLSAFGAVLRQDVELAMLQEHLVEVVEETMQPVHISLWLRSTRREVDS